MSQIVKISVFSMYETCERTTYYVRATTDEGLTKEVEAHRTGSIYTNHEGLTKEEARDRALIDAHTWADFLGLTPEPFIEDDIEHKPSMTMSTYKYQRDLARRRSIGSCEDRDGVHIYRGRAVYAVPGHPPECMECGGAIPFRPEQKA